MRCSTNQATGPLINCAGWLHQGMGDRRSTVNRLWSNTVIAKTVITVWIGWLAVLCSASVSAQSQTTGRVAGTVKDERGAVIVGAEVTVSSKTTAEERTVTTDDQGNYTVPILAPGTYRVRVVANGFNSTLFDSVQVIITATTTV